MEDQSQRQHQTGSMTRPGSNQYEVGLVSPFICAAFDSQPETVGLNV